MLMLPALKMWTVKSHEELKAHEMTRKLTWNEGCYSYTIGPDGLSYFETKTFKLPFRFLRDSAIQYLIADVLFAQIKSHIKGYDTVCGLPCRVPEPTPSIVGDNT